MLTLVRSCVFIHLKAKQKKIATTNHSSFLGLNSSCARAPMVVVEPQKQFLGFPKQKSLKLCTGAGQGKWAGMVSKEKKWKNSSVTQSNIGYLGELRARVHLALSGTGFLGLVCIYFQCGRNPVAVDALGRVWVWCCWYQAPRWLQQQWEQRKVGWGPRLLPEAQEQVPEPTRWAGGARELWQWSSLRCEIQKAQIKANWSSGSHYPHCWPRPAWRPAQGGCKRHPLCPNPIHCSASKSLGIWW